MARMSSETERGHVLKDRGARVTAVENEGDKGGSSVIACAF